MCIRDRVYCGLNTQMLLYLFTLRSNAAQVYKNPVAAGVLYLAGEDVYKRQSYDISNWGDGTSVAGMVVLEDGKPKKAGYRLSLIHI